MLKAFPFLISLLFVISHGGMVSLPYSQGCELGVVTGDGGSAWATEAGKR